MPLEFAQEFCCEFMPEGSRIIPLEVYAQCVNPEIWFGEEFIPESGTNYVMGIDFARKKDKTVIVILSVKDRMRVAYVKVFENEKYSKQLDYIVYLNSICPSLMKINTDKTTVGIPLTEDLEDRIGSKVEGFTFSVPTKEGLFTGLKTALVDKTIELPPDGLLGCTGNDKDIKDQIIGMRKTISVQGNSHYEGDEDDFFWALSLAIKASPQSKFTSFVSGIVQRPENSGLSRLPMKVVSSRFVGMFPQQREGSNNNFRRIK